MGQNNQTVTDRTYLEAEQKVLLLSGLPLDKIKAHDVQIWEGCKIRTIEVGFDK
jgi:hypothetical protein